MGGSQRVQFLDTSIQNINWAFNGPDGNSATTALMQPYVMQVYKDMDSDYGFHGSQWMSPMRTWRAYQLNPRLYAKTAAQQFAEENYRIDNSEYIEEKVQAAYLQAEATLWRTGCGCWGRVPGEDNR